MVSSVNWDKAVDVLVVGSGNGAMTTALCAYEMGAKNVLVVEKASRYGGTSAISAGAVWIPGNRYAKAAGANDTYEEAHTYLATTIPEEDFQKDLIDCFLTEGPRMIDFLHERGIARYRSLGKYPDYHSYLPGAKTGHRSMEPEPIDASELGDDYDTLMPNHTMMLLLGVIPLTLTEAHDIMTRAKGWLGLATKLLTQYASDIPWRLRYKIARRLTLGCAGMARLRLGLKNRGIPLWLNSPMIRLIEEGGGVTGAIVEHEGKRLNIRALKGVMLGAGGFEHNQPMRERYLPKPTDKAWSAGVKTNTGDALWEGMRLGGATGLMDSAWWATTMSVPGEAAPRLDIIETSYPGSCLVNKKGLRFANESQDYMSFQKKLYAVNTDEVPCAPMYHIFDARFRRTYVVGPLLTSKLRPDWTFPKRWYTEGFIAKANTIGELADKFGIDRKGLETTIATMNEYARTGKDLDFNRGDAIYDRYYGDPAVKPNSCLAPIVEPPFYAMRVDAGDLGTQGGLVINANGQVMHRDGVPIKGLYAVGNCTVALLPTYPGPGATLGPAMTFGYQAAKHMTGYNAAYAEDPAATERRRSNVVAADTSRGG